MIDNGDLVAAHESGSAATPMVSAKRMDWIWWDNATIIDTGDGRLNCYALVAAIGAWLIRRPCFAIQYCVHSYGDMVNALCR